jgi:hypothetical protein
VDAKKLKENAEFHELDTIVIAILRLYLKNLRDCNVSVTEGRNL